jgi:HSP20 family molecular chaperone IbpA
MTTRPDSFLPQVDIIKSDEMYKIYMEIPGMKLDEIEIYRQNVMTIIKGVKKSSY